MAFAKRVFIVFWAFLLMFNYISTMGCKASSSPRVLKVGDSADCTSPAPHYNLVSAQNTHAAGDTFRFEYNDNTTSSPIISCSSDSKHNLELTFETSDTPSNFPPALLLPVIVFAIFLFFGKQLVMFVMLPLIVLGILMLGYLTLLS